MLDVQNLIKTVQTCAELLRFMPSMMSVYLEQRRVFYLLDLPAVAKRRPAMRGRVEAARKAVKFLFAAELSATWGNEFVVPNQRNIGMFVILRDSGRISPCSTTSPSSERRGNRGMSNRTARQGRPGRWTSLVWAASKRRRDS